MRRLSGENTGLKAGLLINSCVLLFLVFSTYSFCQIPINGFCSLKSYQVPEGYQNIISSDLNFDLNDELIFYSPSSKKIGVFDLDSSFGNNFNEIQILPEVSQLKQLKYQGSNERHLVAVERKNRKVSLLTAINDSLFEKVSEISFDSYPEKISLGDVDMNGVEEILVAGSGFDGVSILYLSELSFGETKISSGASFSEAVFIDFDADDYQDILAFNILENSLEFYFNNTNGEYSLKRSIQYPQKINLLHTVDLDKDGFQDIVYSLANRIEFLYGDFQSGYERSLTLQISDTPLKIQFGDFNSDGLTDLVYLTSQKDINVHFGKKDGFFEEITYLSDSSIHSFTKFNLNNSESIALLSEDAVSIITTLTEYGGNLSIVPAVQAGAIRKFDLARDEIPDLSFIDEYDNSLKLLVSNDKGIPSTYYSFELGENHKEIMVDEFFKRRKIFYCYKEGSPLIEVFRYNFFTNKLYRKQLYAPGGILDLSLQRIDSTLVNVFLVYNKNSKMYLGKFENRDLSVTFREYPFVDRNVSEADLFIQENPVIYYWKTEDDSLYFNLAEIKTGPNIYKNYYKLSQAENPVINIFGAENYNTNYPSVVSFIQLKNEMYTLVLDDNLAISNEITDQAGNNLRVFKRGYFGATSIKGIINFTVNTENDDYIYRLVFNETEKKYILKNLIEAGNINDYFFARLDSKNYYLVNSNKTEGHLSIHPLKK